MFLTFTYLFLQIIIFYCSKIRTGKNRHRYRRQVKRKTLHDATGLKFLQMSGRWQKNPKREDWRRHCK